MFVAVSLFTSSPVVSAATDNLIANPSVETLSGSSPANWSTNKWGTNNASFSYTNTGYSSHGLRVDVSGYANGDAKWMHDQVAVTPGTEYTYSDFSRSSATTEIDAAYIKADGSMSFAYLNTVPASSDWQQTSVSFTPPAGVVSVSVYHILPGNGWLETDVFSLDTQVVTPPSPPTTEPQNLLPNASFEESTGSNPTAWNRGGWGSNTATLEHLSNAGHTGTRSVRVAMSSYSSGDAKWYATPVAVESQKSYTYSDYYKADVATRVIAVVTSGGVDSYIELPTAPAQSNWSKYTSTITTPAGADTVTFYHLLDRVGSLTLDDVQLTATTTTDTPTPPTPEQNYISNPSLETVQNTVPAGWQKDSWGANTTQFNYVNGDAHTGQRSAKVTISGYADGDAKWYPTPLTNLTPGSQYRFSVWYKTNAQPSAVGTYTDQAGNDHYFSMPYVSRGADAASVWQHYSDVFTVPANATSFSMFFLIAGNGWLQTDDYSIEDSDPTGFDAPMLSLTFDDGWSSIYTNGLPLLDKYDLTSTQYITTGFLNDQPDYMTDAMVREFLASGHEIGSHTVTHSDLSTLDATTLNFELTESQARLRQLLGANVASSIASPFGSYNDSTLSTIKQSYQSHRSTTAGFNTKDNFDPYRIRVQNIETTTTSQEVAAWVDEAKANNAWLVLVYHQVTNSTDVDDYAVTLAKLDAELAYINASGIQTLTVSQALAAINAQQ